MLEKLIFNYNRFVYRKENKNSILVLERNTGNLTLIKNEGYKELISIINNGYYCNGSMAKVLLTRGFITKC